MRSWDRFERFNYYSIWEKEIPDGYITGMVRDGYNYNTVVAHLYKGTVDDPGYPMCLLGWNRENHTAYSIWRNNVGEKGICKVCLRRAKLGLEPVDPSPELVDASTK